MSPFVAFIASPFSASHNIFPQWGEMLDVDPEKNDLQIHMLRRLRLSYKTLSPK